MVLIYLVSFVEEMTDHCGVEFFKKQYFSGTLLMFFFFIEVVCKVKGKIWWHNLYILPKLE